MSRQKYKNDETYAGVTGLHNINPFGIDTLFWPHLEGYLILRNVDGFLISYVID